MAYHFLGGLLAHAPALTALCAPTVNSYKRLVVGRSLSGATWAPAYITYGDNNRSAMVRIPTGGSSCACPTAPATRTSPPPPSSRPAWTASSASSIRAQPHNDEPLRAGAPPS